MSSVFQQQLAQLDQDDWKQGLAQTDAEGRRLVARLLEVASPKRMSVPLLMVKSHALKEQEARALGGVLTGGTLERGRALLGAAAAAPTLEDLCGILASWQDECRPGLVRLCLVLLAASDAPAASHATELLDGGYLEGVGDFDDVGDDGGDLPGSPREPVLAAPEQLVGRRSQGLGHDEPSVERSSSGQDGTNWESQRHVVGRLSEVMERTATAMRELGGIIGMANSALEAGDLPSRLIGEAEGSARRIASLVAEADEMAREVLEELPEDLSRQPVARIGGLLSTVEGQLETERRQGAELEHARLRSELIEDVEARLAALRTLRAPEGQEETVQKVMALAQAPRDGAPDSVDEWLAQHDVLESLLDHVSGTGQLPPAQYAAVIALAGPSALGLLLAGQFVLSSAADDHAISGVHALPPEVIPVADVAPVAGNTVAIKPQAPRETPAGVEDTPADRVMSVGTDLPVPVSTDRVGAPEGVVESSTQPEAPSATSTLKSAMVDGQYDSAAVLAHAVTADTLDTGTGLPAPVSDSSPLESPLDRDAASTYWGGVAELTLSGEHGTAAWAGYGLDPQFQLPLEVVALASELRSDAGPLAEALWTRCESLRSGLPDDPDARVILAAGLAVVAPTAPFVGGADLLETLLPDLSARPDLRSLADSVINAARQGLRLDEHSLGAGRDQAARTQIEECRETARIQLAAATSRNLKFHPATRVHRALMAEDGRLGRLLCTVRDNALGRLEDARYQALSLGDGRELDRTIDEIDSELRAPRNARALVGHPRARLVELARESLAVVDQWCRAATALEKPSHSAEHTNALTAAVRDVNAALLTSLSSTQHPSVSGRGAVVDAVVAAMAARLDLMLTSGSGHDGQDEPTIEEVLDRRLPWIYEQRLARDMTDHLRIDTVIGLLDSASRDPVTAYAGFAERLDHWGTARLVEAVAKHSPEVAGQLRQYREHDLPAARQVLHRRVDKAQSLLDELEAYPLALTIDQAVRARTLLSEADEPEGDDIRLASERVEVVQELLASAHAELVAKLRGEIRMANLPETDVDAALGLLDQGELGAVYERIEGAQPGSTQPLNNLLVQWQRKFLNEQVDAAAMKDLFATAENSLREGVAFAPFGDGPVDLALRHRNADALVAWRLLFKDKQAHDFDLRIQRVLALIGLQTKAPRSIRGRGTYIAIDVEDAQPVLPVVSYELGSAAGGKYRVIVVWNELTPGQLMSLVVNDEKQGPHLLLYNGSLNRQKRTALADLAHSDVAATRRLLVVDDTVCLAMAFHPRPSFAALEHLTLPFAHVAVFAPDVAGNVPPELFQGRRREIAEVLDHNGSSFVYGGRQVGKSALLRAAAREVERGHDEDQRAVYLDVKGLGIGMWRDAEDLWFELSTELRRKQVLTDRTSHNIGGDAMATQILGWLDAVPTRKLLVLLDECDDLLDADAKQEFAVVQRLRRLITSSDRRFKVVLAGLHQVQRFEHQVNVPLDHMVQQPIQVGPLQAADAVNLINAPLLALGYELSEAATWRLLSKTNYQAGMIQLFGQALLQSLYLTPRPVGAPPTPVNSLKVDEVFRSAGLAQQMRRRFMLTIDLDPKYRCIAFAMAYHNLQNGLETACDDEELQNACSTYWPAAFAEMRPALFSDLVDEMQGLGVLARTSTGLRIRNPNIVRLLGTLSTLEGELLDFDGRPPPSGFEPSNYRRALPGGGRSPLTEEELGLIVQDTPRLVIIGGTRALGVQKVATALKAQLSGKDVEFAQVEPDSMLSALKAATTRVAIVADCSGLTPDRVRELALTLNSHLTSLPHATAMRRAVLLLDGRSFDLWSDELPVPSGLEAALRLGLRRLTIETLDAWAGDEKLDLPPAERAPLLRATGGWPILVDQVLATGSSRSRSETLGGLSAALTDPARAEGLLDDVLGGSDTGRLGLELLADLGGPVTWSEVAELASDREPNLIRAALTALQLTETVGDDRFQLEQVLLNATRTLAVVTPAGPQL